MDFCVIISIIFILNLSTSIFADSTNEWTIITALPQDQLIERMAYGNGHILSVPEQ